MTKKEENYKQFKELYNSEMRPMDLAKQFNCSFRSIMRIRDKLNLPKKTPIYKYISPETFKKAYLSGKTFNELQKQFKCGHATLLSLRDRFKLPKKTEIKDYYTIKRNINIIKFKELWEEGLSYKRIAEYFKCEEHIIYKVKDKLKLSNRIKVTNTNLKDKKIQKEICRYYKEGINSAILAEKYNCSSSAIIHILRKYNIKIIINKFSKPMKIFEEFLVSKNILYKSEFNLERKFYDFFIEPNILIEIDGNYWHGNPKYYKELNKRQKRAVLADKIKNRIAKDNKYNLLRIWEDEIYDGSYINKFNIFIRGLK